MHILHRSISSALSYLDSFPRLPVAGSWCASVVTAARDAAVPPGWETLLPTLQERLKEQVDKAKTDGAFTFSITFSLQKRPLYIRPDGLYEKVMKALLQVTAGTDADSKKPRGVLIYGGNATGKTSLARDIAFEVACACDSGECQV